MALLRFQESMIQYNLNVSLSTQKLLADDLLFLQQSVQRLKCVNLALQNCRIGHLHLFPTANNDVCLIG